MRTSRLRNPDFVVIEDRKYLKNLNEYENWYEIQDKVSKDFIECFIKIRRIIQLNGYYWHFQRFEGRTKEEYEKDMIEEFKMMGKECLVIWDIEIHDNFEKVKERIYNFLETK